MQSLSSRLVCVLRANWYSEVWPFWQQFQGAAKKKRDDHRRTAVWCCCVLFIWSHTGMAADCMFYQDAYTRISSLLMQNETMLPCFLCTRNAKSRKSRYAMLLCTSHSNSDIQYCFQINQHDDEHTRRCYPLYACLTCDDTNRDTNVYSGAFMCTNHYIRQKIQWWRIPRQNMHSQKILWNLLGLCFDPQR